MLLAVEKPNLRAPSTRSDSVCAYCGFSYLYQRVESKVPIADDTSVVHTLRHRATEGRGVPYYVVRAPPKFMSTLKFRGGGTPSRAARLFTLLALPVMSPPPFEFSMPFMRLLKRRNRQ